MQEAQNLCPSIHLFSYLKDDFQYLPRKMLDKLPFFLKIVSYLTSHIRSGALSLPKTTLLRVWNNQLPSDSLGTILNSLVKLAEYLIYHLHHLNLLIIC